MLEGRLGDFTLPDILRLLAFTAKSGRLRVSADGVEARVDVLEGRIRDASADTATLGIARRLLGQDLLDAETLDRALEGLEAIPTDLELARHLVETDGLDAALLADLAREQVIDALFALLRWSEGSFRFETRVPEQRGPSVLDLALPVDDTLDEVGRRLEAHAAVEERTGHPDAAVTIRRPGRERAEVGLSPEGWTLLALVDGRRTVADLVRLSGQGEYRTRRTLASLMDEGIVAVGDASEPPPTERLVRAHETLADHEARLTGQPADEAPAAAPRPSDPVSEEVPGVEAPEDEVAGVGVAHDEVPRTEAAGTEAPDAEVAGTEATEQPEPARAQEPEPARAEEPEDAHADERPTPPGVTPLRARARRPRLRTDPEVDEDLLRQLIDGVESL